MKTRSPAQYKITLHLSSEVRRTTRLLIGGTCFLMLGLSTVSTATPAVATQLSSRSVVTQSLGVPPILTLDRGSSFQLVASGIFAGGLHRDITHAVSWASSNPASVSVSNTGMVEVAPSATSGANITVRSGNLLSEVAVTVQSPPFGNSPPRIDSISASALSAPVNTTISLTALAHDPDLDPLFYQWSSTGSCAFGTPTALSTTFLCNDAGSHTVSLTVIDGVGQSVAQSFAIDVIANPGYSSVSVLAGSPMKVASTALPSVTRGLSYHAQLYFSGGVAPCTWKALTALPRGLSLLPSGKVVGTVGLGRATGHYHFQVRATDATRLKHKSSVATVQITIT